MPTVGSKTVESTKIVLSIDKPEGGVDKYLIDCTLEGGEEGETCNPANRGIPVTGDTDEVEYANLTPHREYRFDVKSKKGDKESPSVTKRYITQESGENAQCFHYLCSKMTLTCTEAVIHGSLALSDNLLRRPVFQLPLCLHYSYVVLEHFRFSL